MRTLLLTLLLGAAAPAHAVDVCRYAETEGNAFDDGSQITIPGVGFRVEVVDGVGTAIIRLSTAGLVDRTLPAGTAVTWALDNGTKVTLYANEAASPIGTAYATQYTAGVYTSWDLQATVTAEAAHAMAQSRTVAVRYAIGDQKVTKDVPKPTGGRNQLTFACAAHHITPLDG